MSPPTQQDVIMTDLAIQRHGLSLSLYCGSGGVGGGDIRLFVVAFYRLFTSVFRMSAWLHLV